MKFTLQTPAGICRGNRPALGLINCPIVITARQRRWLESRSDRSGLAIAEVIRQALDHAMANESPIIKRGRQARRGRK